MNYNETALKSQWYPPEIKTLNFEMFVFMPFIEFRNEHDITFIVRMRNVITLFISNTIEWVVFNEFRINYNQLNSKVVINYYFLSINKCTNLLLYWLSLSMNYQISIHTFHYQYNTIQYNMIVEIPRLLAKHFKTFLYNLYF